MDLQFLKRLGEKAIVAFVAGAAAALSADPTGLSRAALTAAVTAGLAAIYGVLAKGVGDDKSRPDVL